MGALTTKPFAFTMRTWETLYYFSFDIFDSSLTPILMEVRGTDLMRILPRNDLPRPFITDVCRFGFDTYKRHRLRFPYWRAKANQPFIQIDLEQALNLTNQILSLDNKVHGIVANHVDMETLAAFRQLYSSQEFSAIFLENETLENTDIVPALTDFSLSLKTYKTIILWDLIPKWELPLLDFELRLCYQSEIEIYSFNAAAQSCYPLYFVGASIAIKQQFLRGRHPLSILDNILVISLWAETLDLSMPFVTHQKIPNVVVQPAASLLGLIPSFKKIFSKPTSIFLLQADPFIDVDSSINIIYVGYQAPSIKAHLLIPSEAPYESDCHFLHAQSLKLLSLGFICTGFSEVPPSWALLRAMHLKTSLEQAEYRDHLWQQLRSVIPANLTINFFFKPKVNVSIKYTRLAILQHIYEQTSLHRNSLVLSLFMHRTRTSSIFSSNDTFFS